MTKLCWIQLTKANRKGYKHKYNLIKIRNNLNKYNWKSLINYKMKSAILKSPTNN